MSELEDALRTHREAIINEEQAAESEMLREYARANEIILQRANVLLQRVQLYGGRITNNWLYETARIAEVFVTVETQMRRFANSAEETTQVHQLAAMNKAVVDSATLLKAAAGPVPDGFVYPRSFLLTNPRPVEEFIARTSAGAPFHRLLQEIPGEAVDTVRRVLTPAIIEGEGIRRTAARLAAELEIPKKRALTITRTEILGAVRDAALEALRERPTAVQEWIWRAARNGRTCAVCLALDGRVFPTDQRMGTHPNCRCTLVPRPKSWKELGIDLPDRRPKRQLGEEWFKRQSDEMKVKILGPTKFRLYESGDLALIDLVGYRNDETWGEIRWERSLKDIRTNRNPPTEKALGRVPN